MKKLAVAGGENESMLQCCRQAKDLQIAFPIIVGDVEKTKEVAKRINVDISDFELIDVKDEEESANVAVKLVHDKKADMYAKGSVNSEFFLKAVLDRKIGLRTDRPISGITVFEIPKKDKLLFFTDPCVRAYPTLHEKVSIIHNAVDVAHSLGFVYPKVAPVTAIEIINPIMPETLEALELTKMGESGEFKDCIIDGPMSFDLAVNQNAPKYKKTQHRKIRGDADILLFPNIHAANIAYFTVRYLVNNKSGTVLSGTSAPCIFNPRSGSAESKLNSIVIATIYAQYLENQGK